MGFARLPLADILIATRLSVEAGAVPLVLAPVSDALRTVLVMKSTRTVQLTVLKITYVSTCL